MGVFRSEKMLLCQILFSQETVFDCIEVLGNIGLVEFRDLNASVAQHQKRYVADVRRCEEMERKLRFLEEEMEKSETEMVECKELPYAPRAKQTLSFESNLETLVNEIQNVNKSVDALRKNLAELIEQYHVITKGSVWIKTNQPILTFDEERSDTDLDPEKRRDKGIGRLKITTGVIPIEKLKSFEMLLWRICRGVGFLKIIHIPEIVSDPDTDIKVKKAVFVIICQGDCLNDKISKICRAFHCNLYRCPTTDERRRILEKEAVTSIKETEQVMEKTLSHRKRVLAVAGTELEKWKLQVTKLKSIYHIMNMLQLDEINEFQSAECWLPEKDIHFIKEKLNAASEKDNNQNDPIIIVMQHNQKPPTFNRSNDFTRGFQNLIDAYGVSGYREMNPMPFAVVTFPFLFAVMFGDVGHSMILSIFSGFMIIYESKLKGKRNLGEIGRIFFAGRYIILLMGLFGCYTGLIYNDFFSKSINLFGSSWRINQNLSLSVSDAKMVWLYPHRNFAGRSYLFGIDPVWQVSENKIVFLNSFKMKISIIFGVAHMIFGILLNLGNHIYFGKYSNILTELFPQIVFFSCLFGYLVNLIFMKWILYGPFNGEAEGIHCAPNILITFINMFLSMFKKVKESEPPCSIYMYRNQSATEAALVLTALICIPWLLVSKTLVLLESREKEPAKGSPESALKGRKMSVPENEETEPGEIIIHQAIRTIEFVLGSISHTASYLRLWALSLAHAQLSEVLWRMVLSMGLSSRGIAAGFFICVTFAIWATFTVGVLVVVEGLSAFLHTLRLHWIEFQSKFYSGSGRPFKPYSFEKLFSELDFSSSNEKQEPKTNSN